MTHPLTPREAVEYWLDLAMTTGANKQDFNMSEAVDGVMSALASGSGDHAELARLAYMADWMADGDPGANGSVLLSASVASEHASGLKALLAENAALRSANTEAERKLAEAMGLLREAADGHPLNVNWGRIDAWLSKEAERG